MLEAAGLEDKLEAARVAFAQTFPLPEHLWLPWVSGRLEHARELVSSGRADELAEHSEQMAWMLARAVQDCPWSVALWKARATGVQLLSVVVPELDLDAQRAVFEEAVAVLGHHPQRGAEVWKQYLDWDQEMAMTLEQMGHDVSAQTLRIRALFVRALEAPLREHADVLAEYQEWEEDDKKRAGVEKRAQVGVNGFALRAGREKSVQALEKEGALEAAAQDLELYTALGDYLGFEETQLSAKKDKGKREIGPGVALFERGLSVFATLPELWVRYHSFLSKWAPEERLLSWAQRAARHCRWSGTLQALVGRTLHKLGGADAAEAHLEAALTGGLAGADDFHAVYAALVDCFGPDKYDAAHEEALRTYFSDRPDLLASVLELRGHRARRAGDMDAYQTLWEAALKCWGASSWDTWARYIAGMSDETKIRSLYKRTINAVQDAPESSFASWVLWERQGGDPASVLDAMIAVERRQRQVNAARAQWQKKQQEQEQSQPRSAGGGGDKKKQQKPQRSEASEPGTATDEPKEDKSARTIFVKNLSFDMDEEHLRAVFAPVGTIVELRLMRDANKQSRGFAFVEFSSREECGAALVFNGRVEMERPMVVMPSTLGLGQTGVTPVNTLYISNLPYAVEEEDVRAAFAAAAASLLATNPITSVRVLRKSDGTSKGGAFVEFRSNLAPDTVKLDGIMQVKGRSIKVEIAKPKNSKGGQHRSHEAEGGPTPARPQSPAREPVQKRVKVDLEGEAPAAPDAPAAAAEAYDDSRTVFVGSIAVGASEAMVRDQFEALCGPVLKVRLVSKVHTGGAAQPGKAYVDFATAEARAAALLLSGKLAILDRPVLVSQPKPRDKGKSLKGTGFSSTPDPKPVATLVPPSLARKRKTAEKAAGPRDTTPKTQDQFRAMLLKK